MRIDSLKLQNFKRFREQTFELHPRFTLLVGENGAGKTSVLDALAVALGIWLVEVPESSLVNSRRNIMPSEILLAAQQNGDRIQFVEQRPVSVTANGQIAGEAVSWTRGISQTGTRTSNANAKKALAIIQKLYAAGQSGQPQRCPVIAYYGAGRAWLPSYERPEEKRIEKAGRWAALYRCLHERIRIPDLNAWFQREAIEAGNRGGQARPGYVAVQRAIMNCVPGCDRVYFDADQAEIVLSLDGKAQPFENLSAGQKMMLALVADIAIKAVTQNAHLLDGSKASTGALPAVLSETDGVVLIDELDVHLHPSWQRRIAADLQRTFAGIQFVCTSHSPQVIGELRPEQIRMLNADGMVSQPAVAYGADSNWILDHVLSQSSSVNTEVKALMEQAEQALLEDRLDEAQLAILQLRKSMPGDIGALVRLESSLASLRALAADSDSEG